MLGLAWKPFFDGFVHSEEELEDEIYRRDWNFASFYAAGWDYNRAKYEELRKKTPEAEPPKPEAEAL